MAELRRVTETLPVVHLADHPGPDGIQRCSVCQKILVNPGTVVKEGPGQPGQAFYFDSGELVAVGSVFTQAVTVAESQNLGTCLASR